jgi:hydrogenase maturation protease
VSGTGPVVVAALGSVDRSDDGAGPRVLAGVAARLPGVRAVGPLADPLDLLGLWDGARLAVVVDAVRSGSAPGTVHLVELDAGLREGPATADGTARGRGEGATSSHGIGLAGVVRLARAVGRAPARVVVVGVEGERFGPGGRLSPAVAAAVPAAVRRVVGVVEEVVPCA